MINLQTVFSLKNQEFSLNSIITLELYSGMSLLQELISIKIPPPSLPPTKTIYIHLYYRSQFFLEFFISRFLSVKCSNNVAKLDIFYLFQYHVEPSCQMCKVLTVLDLFLPKTSLYILHALLCTFPLLLPRGIRLTIKAFQVGDDFLYLHDLYINFASGVIFEEKLEAIRFQALQGKNRFNMLKTVMLYFPKSFPRITFTSLIILII